MNTLQLVQGRYTRPEALELITRLVDVKIRYHEDRIRSTASEEDIEMRESRIRQLQNELASLRQQLLTGPEWVTLQSVLETH
ncbi:MAG TPA: hypothetical protein VG870_13295 [Chitinophagaceae bacterium]|nr:hypothetical protein [Chitinophagaceae bacterium]